MKATIVSLAYLAALSVPACLALLLACKLMMSGMVWQPLLVLLSGALATVIVANTRITIGGE